MHMRAFTPVTAALGLAVLAACGGGSGGAGQDAGQERDGPPDRSETSTAVSLPLPSGHGIASGVIRVPPGTSAVHGNILVSCPPGGQACVLTVAADRTASYDGTGGAPAVTAWRHSRGFSRDNPSAEDLLDHWNDSQALRTAMRLSAVRQADIAERKGRLKSLLDGVGGSPEDAGVMFRNVRVEDIEIIGERNGITYGQWKRGPAGTLNMEFDWTLALNVDVTTRVLTERVGKLWTWRLQDDFGTHTAMAGTTLRDGPSTARLADDLVADDIAVVMWHTSENLDYAASAGPDATVITDDDFEPWRGHILLVQDRYLEGSNHWTYFLMAHEIGHILGITDIRRNVGHVPSYERHVNREDATFEGPQSQAANNGRPVPFMWRERFNAGPEVPPHTPGAFVDYGHLGVCTSVMAFCSDAREVHGPSELDFAFLADIGYEVLDEETASEAETYGWGAWGEHSAWGIGVDRRMDYASDDRAVHVQDQLWAGADAFGIAPATALTDSTALGGTATWSGSLLGADLGRPMLPPVVGNAELQVHLSSLAGTARFDDLTVYVENRPAPFRTPSLEYVIDVNGNLFSDAGGHVQGSFHGPAHEEMAGVLDDRSPNVNLLAGFGGRR